MNFQVTTHQQIMINKWLEEIKPLRLEKCPPNQFTDGEPYTGAIGGSLTYEFTPTGLGVVLVVKDEITGQELNVTDYDSW